MNFESVSVESPRLPPPGSPPVSETETGFRNDGREASESGVSDGLLKQILIEIALEKIAVHGLCGHEHVRQYLMDLYAQL